MARGYKGLHFEWNGSASAIIQNLGFGEELNRAAAEILHDYAEPYVPYKSGRLNNAYNIHANNNGARITHYVKYAGIQYERVAKHRTTTVHPLATDHWYDYAWLNHKAEITADIDETRAEILRRKRGV